MEAYPKAINKKLKCFFYLELFHYSKPQTLSNAKMSATKQTNQRILFDEYLKECYKNYIEKRSPTQAPLREYYARVEEDCRQGGHLFAFEFNETNEEQERYGDYEDNDDEDEEFKIARKALRKTISQRVSCQCLCFRLGIVYYSDYYEMFEKPTKKDKDWFNQDGEERARDWGKIFFDFAKEKAVEMGMPKSTFKTITETRPLARKMLQEWWSSFHTTEEIMDWFEGENDIMLK